MRYASPKKARRIKWRKSEAGKLKRSRYNYEGKRPLERHMSVGEIQHRQMSGPQEAELTVNFTEATGPDTSAANRDRLMRIIP